jgi:hypothetical protein
MKYYCSECKSELITNEPISKNCRFCKGTWLELLPDFETPEQYEKRTGKKWNGAVWFRYRHSPSLAAIYGEWSKWQANNPIENWREEYSTQLLCAASPEPPPDDYVPEIEKSNKAWIIFLDINGAGTCQRCPECGNKYRMNYDLGYSAIYREKCECGFESKELEREDIL